MLLFVISIVMSFTGKYGKVLAHFLDFTRPETRTWWSGLYKDFMANGIDGIWNDMNEPSVFDGPGERCRRTIFI